ncbi:MAG: hypothetical protein QE283_09235 [Rhodoferax sp.]|nr:hypothetical protein [Rhodoferax sp.]
MNINTLISTADVPESVLSFPSMMTSGEKALLFHLARDHFQGTGIIVDAGLFLGASTEAFCRGLKENGIKTKKIVHAYDIALWNSKGFDKYLQNPGVLDKIGPVDFKDGDNYQSLLEKLLEEHSDTIDFRIGDIVEQVRTNEDVEIAFYDLLKNYERDLACFNALGPHYVANRTIIVQQDYFFENAIDSKVRQEFLSPYFEFIGAIGSSGVFKCIRKIPTEFFEKDPIKKLTVDDKIKLLKQAAGRIPISKFQIYTSLAVVGLMIQSGRKEEGISELQEVEKAMKYAKLTPPRAAKIIEKLKDKLEGARLR